MCLLIKYNRSGLRDSTWNRSEEPKLRLHILGGKLGTWTADKEGGKPKYVEPRNGPKVLGEVKLADITPELVNRALDNARCWRGAGTKGAAIETEKPISQRTKELCWDHLAQALSFAVREGLMVSNPLRPGADGLSVGRPVVPRKPPRRTAQPYPRMGAPSSYRAFGKNFTFRCIY